MIEKVVLVTGASSGIGYAIAERLSARFRTVLSSKSPDKLDAALCNLKSCYPDRKISSLMMDVQDDSSIVNGVQHIIDSMGSIDVLINNAGVGGGGRTPEFSFEQWKHIIDTNLNGVFKVTHTVLNRSKMLENQWGRIINIASTGGKQGVMFAAAYSASKHGVVGFSKALGLELARTGITVNAVCPGFVETPLADRARANYSKIWHCSVEEAKARIEERVPIGRYIDPNEVANLVDFLSTEEANGIVAQAYNVCGGLGNY